MIAGVLNSLMAIPNKIINVPVKILNKITGTESKVKLFGKKEREKTLMSRRGY
tara:strand:+ start:171 stop:329 length:159 start_codon:yes stop_codon:yes gene_type:complete